ncbi:MAG: transporter [Candidatus Caenarcaniphilales bacterium]|jgi:hypothetical protein|nr:transporter [Candidatus Caenarcaniphilales bacterium]
MKKTILSLVALAAINFNSAKADVMHFERGGASTVPGIVEKGQLNLEGGLFNYADEFGGDGSYGFAIGASKIRYGIHERFELRATNAGLIINDSLAGFDNLGLGFKLALLEEEHGLMPVVNIVTDFQIPIGREELRNPGFDHTYLLSMSHSIAGKLSTAANLGLGFVANEAADGHNYTSVNVPYVLNFSYAVNDKLGVFTDTYGSWGLTGGTSDPVSQDLGFAYVINDNFIVDASLNMGLNESAPDFGIDTGFAVRLK